MVIPDLLNRNSIVLINESDLLFDFNQRFESVGLELPVPFLIEKKNCDTISKVYEYALDNNLDFVTCYSKNALPRKDVNEKFSKEFKEFNDPDWGIISYSRSGDISGYYAGNINNILKEPQLNEILKNIKNCNEEYNDYLLRIPAYSFGSIAFSINIFAFPLLIDRLHRNGDSLQFALSNSGYDHFMYTYHTKDLYFVECVNKKYAYPQNYNVDRSGYIGWFNDLPDGF